MNVKFTFDDNKFANIKIDSFEIKGFDNAIFDGKVIVLGSTVDSELSYESKNAIENKAVAKGKADIIVNSVSGDVALFPDGAALPVENLIATITPVQDLHGYDSPWPAGGGVNKWDEVWEQGSIDNNTGQDKPASTGIRGKNYIPVVAGESYYICNLDADNLIRCYYYDSDYGFVSSTAVNNSVLTIPSGVSYMRIRSTGTYGNVYKNDWAVNYPATVTTYSPYSNICPITGWTGANVYRTGENLHDDQTDTVGYYINASGNITKGTGYRYTALIPVDVGATYIFSGMSTAPYNYFRRVHGYDANGEWVSQISFEAVRDIRNFTILAVIPQNISYVRLSLRENDENIAFALGDAYPVTFGGTVYAGSLDVTNGILKARPQYASYNGETLVGPWLSSMDVYEEGATPTTGAQVVDLGGTETEYTLTTQQVTTLVGKNTVWVDVGSVFVKYCADTKLYIDNKIAQAISAALNA